MNWGSLSSNEKLAVYGSVAVIIGGLFSSGFAFTGWLVILAAIAMLIVVFLPMMSPNTTLPGSKGSLMLICGGVAAVLAVLGLFFILPWLGVAFGPFGGYLLMPVIFGLIATIGALVMGWAGWQAFQAEGGKFNVGAGGGGTGGGSAGGTSGGGTTSAGGGTSAGAGTAGTAGTTGPMGSGAIGADVGTTTGATTGTTTGTAGTTGSPAGDTTGTTGSDVDRRTTP